MQPLPPTRPGEANYAKSLVLSKMLCSALVVGGDPSFVTRKIVPRLMRHGIHMIGHWPYKKSNGTFPAATELLLILTDMVGHSMTETAVAEATKRGVPVIYGVRKYAVLEQRLRDGGFPEIPALAPKPAVSPKREAARQAEQTPERNRPIVRPLLSPPPEAVDNYLPAHTTEETPMPAADTHSTTLPYDGAAIRKVYMEILSKDPEVSNASAYRQALEHCQALGINAGGERPDLLASIRRSLGIVRPKNRYLDRMLPSTPEAVAGPLFAAPTIDTVPTSEVPEEVLAAAPPREAVAQMVVTPPSRTADAPRTAPTDVKELVQLLRLAMAAEGIERLTVTKDALTFRRVVVEEGEYEV
jgi:hypothetical protein